MKTNFTPGPWRYDRDRGEVMPVDAGRDDDPICQLYHRPGTGGFANDDANGALLAAAPDLYAACDEMLDVLVEFFGAVHDDDPKADLINRVGALLDGIREARHD